MSDKNKKPGKYDIKPYDAAKHHFEIVTADEAGTPQYLPPKQEAQVRNLLNSMAVDQTPMGGMIFVPEKKYKQIQAEMNRGYLFGNKVATGNEENFQLGGDMLGNGFSLPQYRRTYMNAAILNDPKELEHVLAHELGHNAAWLADPNHADLSERGAEDFADVYQKRGRDTRKLWADIENLPMRHVVAIGDKVVAFPHDMTPEDVTVASQKIHTDSQPPTDTEAIRK
jgi:hypothetical protein